MFCIHSKHDNVPKEKHLMQYASFDPGEKNFAIRIERRYKSVVTNKCSSIKTLYQGKHIINYKKIKKSKTPTYCFTVSGIIDILDKYSEFYLNTDIAIIERQMPVNGRMMRLQDVIISYFLLKYPDIVVITVSSKLKGTILETPRNRTNLKQLSVTKSKYLAKKRKDNVYLEYIDTQIKPDDDADTLVQIEAFCRHVGYQRT
jgi:hypothetical protein